MEKEVHARKNPSRIVRREKSESDFWGKKNCKSDVLWKLYEKSLIFGKYIREIRGKKNARERVWVSECVRGTSWGSSSYSPESILSVSRLEWEIHGECARVHARERETSCVSSSYSPESAVFGWKQYTRNTREDKCARESLSEWVCERGTSWGSSSYSPESNFLGSRIHLKWSRLARVSRSSIYGP